MVLSIPEIMAGIFKNGLAYSYSVFLACDAVLISEVVSLSEGNDW